MLRTTLTVLACTLIFAGCTDSKEDFKGSPASEYAPSQAGKYFIYQLDSTVFVNLGSVEEVHKYQEKHVVDAIVPDNLGRPSLRMYRYLRDSAGTQDWRPAGTFMITATKEALEIVESNRRMVRLAAPVTRGNSWKGARFLTYMIKGDSYDPYYPDYNFSIDDDMFEWNYTIESTGETVSFANKTYDDVVTVVAVDESTNVPVTPNTAYAARLLSVDKFARNVGLVYQELILWEYQKRPDGTPYKTGFGITRRLIEHN